MGDDLLNSLFWEYIGRWIFPGFFPPRRAKEVILNLVIVIGFVVMIVGGLILWLR
jgi:hypothetical protein